MQTLGVKQDSFNRELFGRLFENWKKIPFVASNCSNCSWTYFYRLFKLLPDPEILLHEIFVQQCVNLYNSLQRSFLKYKTEKNKNNFNSEYFLDFYDFVRFFFHTYELEFPEDFQVKVAEFHQSLVYAWSSCTYCSTIKNLI